MLALLLAQGTVAAAAANPGARFEAVSGTLPTSGTTDLTITDFGTPDACILFISLGTVDATIAAHALIGIGFMDDTTQGSVGVTFQDATGGAANTNRTIYSSLGSAPLATGAAALDFDIDGTFITDGVQLSITNAPAGAYLCTAWLIGGDGIAQAEVVIQDDLGASATDIPVSLSKVWSAAPDLLFGFTHNGNVALDAIAGQAALSFGISDFTNHRGLSIGGVDTDTGSYMTALMSKTNMLAQAFNDVVSWEAYPHTPTTSNFQMALDASAGNDIAIFLAIGLASGFTSSIDDVTIPTGTDVTVSTGVTPSSNLIVTCSGISAYGTEIINSDIAASFNLYDGTTIASISASIADDPAKSLHSDSLNIITDDGSGSDVVGVPSFNSSNVVWTTSTRPSSAILGYSLSIGVAAGAGSAFIRDLVQDTIQDTISDLVQ